MNDELEQTQDIDSVVYGEFRFEGVYRIIRGAWYETRLERAPDLSERYPSVHIDMTRRQAC